MQDIVIVPTYDRPEMLWLCLEHLAAARGGEQVHVWVYVDAHVNQERPPRSEIIAVAKKFSQLTIDVVFREPHKYSGNSFNVLSAYMEALQTDARYVFLVEDDVMIHPAFFDWHYRQHYGQRLGCSIAMAKGPRQVYASLGVCFRREMLRMLVPHCQHAYFVGMREYIRRSFEPKHQKPPLDCEQDGLIARVLEGHRVVWAQMPLAQHVGWYGYHRARSARPRGSLEDRYRQIKHVLSDDRLLRVWSKDFQDIVPLQLSADAR
jgi:hypothetical protein